MVQQVTQEDPVVSRRAAKAEDRVFQLWQDGEWQDVNETHFYRVMHGGNAKHGRVCRYVLEPVATYDVQDDGSVIRSDVE